MPALPRENLGTDYLRRQVSPFENKAALIFGGAQGIGGAVALEFARRGARIAVANINVAGAERTFPTSEWRRIMDLNFFAAVHGIQVILPKMIERGSGHRM
jgi:NAD(P)-dependent dehydrogenase (short-subunit alcohol dehydrogenase family)